MITPFVAIVTALAVARVTRLVTSDYLTAGPRSKIITRCGPDHKLSYLITCSWCSSLWIGAAAAPMMYWWGHNAWYIVPAFALAASHIVGMLAQIGDE